MCNLYRMRRSSAEVARLFGVDDRSAGANLAASVYPGSTALVVAEGELVPMHWGFPLALRSKRTGEPLKPKPVNNARSDKLDSPFWRASFTSRRCLIPVSDFAEAEGERGAMTRTWFSLPDQPVFACAGIWRDSAEWGRVFSMVMTDASKAVEPVHDRMPVILTPDQHEAWQGADPQEAMAMCAPYAGAIAIDRTDERWG